MIYAACNRQGSIIAATGKSQEIFEQDSEIVAGDYQTSRNKLYLAGKRVKPGSQSLEEMLMDLKEISPSQLGISTKKAYQILFSPKVTLSFPPKDYQKRGGLDDKRLAAYQSFFAEFQALAARNDSQNLAIAIQKLLSFDTGIRRFFVPKHYSLQETLDHELLDRHVKSAVMVLRSRKNIHRQAYTFEKETGCRAWPLQNFPFIAVRGSTKDVNRIISYTRKGMSRFTSRIPYMATTVELCHGVYIPEIISEFVTGHKIVPISAAKALWNLHNIGADTAQQTTDGRGSRIAVVDTGVDYTHHELTSCFSENKGYDLVYGSDPMDQQYHGTHVAGTIGGMTTGVAPGCTLYALRVLDSRGTGTIDNILRAVDWAITNEIDIANFSLGSARGSRIEELVFNKAESKGLVCIAAAGNEGYGPSYPASYDSVISVAAVDRYNNHAKFSNIYHTNNISAPGVGIFSTLPRSDFGVLSGTSMATPHVCGCAGLVASQKSIDKGSFRKYLEKTAEPLGEDGKNNWDMYGCGLVRADKLVVMKRWLAA